MVLANLLLLQFDIGWSPVRHERCFFLCELFCISIDVTASAHADFCHDVSVKGVQCSSKITNSSDDHRLCQTLSWDWTEMGW